MRAQNQVLMSIVLLAGLHNTGCASKVKRELWSQFTTPAGESSTPLGYDSAGCLARAQALKIDSSSYYVMNLSRNRYYGHPNLINYLETLSAQVEKKNLGALMIGDLSQIRGGPMSSGHASHQVGLDADIWFRRISAKEKQTMSREQIANLDVVYLAKDGGMTSDWNDSYSDILRMAAENELVERIFINPTIKKEICTKHPGEPWLAKLRPWWGHDEHFHVRLACPKESPSCKAQKPPEPGDGCGDDLAWWFSDEAKQDEKKLESSEKSDPLLPKECVELAKIPDTVVVEQKR